VITRFSRLLQAAEDEGGSGGGFKDVGTGDDRIGKNSGGINVDHTS
jgi:hypothetical protein